MLYTLNKSSWKGCKNTRLAQPQAVSTVPYHPSRQNSILLTLKTEEEHGYNKVVG